MQSLNWLCQFAGKFFAHGPSAPPQARSKRPCHYRPSLEILEGRLAPAVIIPLASFEGADGSAPTGSLTQDPSGNLFGTTAAGGAYGYGTIFEMAGSSAVTTLASFDRTNGVYPSGPLLEDSHGDLFGTTSEVNVDVHAAWGASPTVFELKAGSGTITTLAHFGVSNLSQDANGNLFGTAYSAYLLSGSGGGGGPDHADDTLVELRAGSSSFISLYSFAGSGWWPSGLVANARGDLFGIATAGGGYGDVFELKAGSNTITTLASFNAATGYPNGPLTMDARGNLFGTGAFAGPSIAGSIFELKADSATISTLTTWTFGPAGSPVPKTFGFLSYQLVVDGSGNIFDTTWDGGANGSGTVVELKAGSSAITAIASFEGASPSGGLIVDANGNLFGTTSGGRREQRRHGFRDRLSRTRADRFPASGLPTTPPPSVRFQWPRLLEQPAL